MQQVDVWGEVLISTLVSKAINFLPDTVVRDHEFCLEMMMQERFQDTKNLLNSICMSHCMCLKLGGLMMHERDAIQLFMM